ncbi:hypothetical protein Ciccas_013995, partial [Cichlidogyrus casuarinus]
FSASANNIGASGGSIISGQSAKHMAQQAQDQITASMRQQAMLNQLAAYASGAMPQSPFVGSSTNQIPVVTSNQGEPIPPETAAFALKFLTGSGGGINPNLAAFQKQLSAAMNASNSTAVTQQRAPVNPVQQQSRPQSQQQPNLTRFY